MGKLDACVTWQRMSLACCGIWPAGAKMYTKTLMTPGRYNPFFFDSPAAADAGSATKLTCSNARGTGICENLTTRQPSASMCKNQPNFPNQRSTKSVQTSPNQSSPKRGNSQHSRHRKLPFHQPQTNMCLKCHAGDFLFWDVPPV